MSSRWRGRERAVDDDLGLARAALERARAGDQRNIIASPSNARR